MKKTLMIVSFMVAGLIILSSLTSVFGVQTKTESTNISPLFYNRLKTMIDKANEEIENNYIGKGNDLNLFINKKSYLRGWMDKAIMLIQSNPEIIDNIFSRIQKIPYTMKLLKENGISKTDLTKYATQIKNNPSLLKQEFSQIQINVDGVPQPPAPKGLSTSNPLGCVITVIALLPIVIVLALLIGTITIITCLNLGGCLETLMQNMFNSILQELIQA